MKSHLRKVLLWLCVWCCTLSVTAQEPGPYYLSLKREIVYGGVGLGTLGLGTYLRSQVGELTLMDLNIREINSFDRIATEMSSPTADKWSDYTLYASLGISGTLLLGRETRRDFLKISVLFMEVMAISNGLTQISKSIFQRPRPYVFDEHWDPIRILSSNDRAAFVSGHTSESAAGTFFFARVFSDYYPDSKLKPFIWGLSIGMPALTGYLRIRSGNHYPTDVIAGYVLGAAVGYLVPTLHKKVFRRPQKKMTPNPNF
ncbi:phosphatase PAP2 family protein [Flavilitoribacter nigricans]|nr:phosphatase PAP2 family protein [Flavilitoribacter nigricans]